MYRLKSFSITLVVVAVFYWIVDKLGWSDIVSAIVSSLSLGLFHFIGFGLLLIAVLIKKDYFFSKGHRLIRKKKYDLAINEFIDETNRKQKASSYNGLGYCYFMLGYNRNAINNYRVALDLDGKLTEIYFLLAILFAEEKEFILAFEHIEKGKIVQENVSILNRLSKININEYQGWVYHQKGDDEKAFHLYAKAIPGFEKLQKRKQFRYFERNAGVYYRMAIIHKLKGEIEKAKEKFERSIQASPPSVFAQKSQEQLDQIAKESWSKPFKDSTFN